MAPGAPGNGSKAFNLYRAASGALEHRRPDAYVGRLIERIGFAASDSSPPGLKPPNACSALPLAQIATDSPAGTRTPRCGSSPSSGSALADGGLEPVGGPDLPGVGRCR